MKTPKAGRRKNLLWTDAMDEEFLEAMVEQCKKGQKVPSGGFRKEGWKEILAHMNSKFGPEGLSLDKEHLRNRNKTMIVKYSMMKELLNQNGFGWNSETKMITAESKVWNAYIKAHPKVSAYRMKKLPDYDSLCIIFSNTVVADGSGSACHDIPQEVCVDESEGLKNTPPADEVLEGNDYEKQLLPISRRRVPATPSSSQALQANVIDGMMSVMNKFCQTLADYATSTNQLQEKVVHALDQMKANGEIADELYFDACYKLTDEKFARTFIALSPENRKGFLSRVTSSG